MLISPQWDERHHSAHPEGSSSQATALHIRLSQRAGSYTPQQNEILDGGIHLLAGTQQKRTEKLSQLPSPHLVPSFYSSRPPQEGSSLQIRDTAGLSGPTRLRSVTRGEPVHHPYPLEQGGHHRSFSSLDPMPNLELNRFPTFPTQHTPMVPFHNMQADQARLETEAFDLERKAHAFCRGE